MISESIVKLAHDFPEYIQFTHQQPVCSLATLQQYVYGHSTANLSLRVRVLKRKIYATTNTAKDSEFGHNELSCKDVILTTGSLLSASSLNTVCFTLYTLQKPQTSQSSDFVHLFCFPPKLRHFKLPEHLLQNICKSNFAF